MRRRARGLRVGLALGVVVAFVVVLVAATTTPRANDVEGTGAAAGPLHPSTTTTSTSTTTTTAPPPPPTTTTAPVPPRTTLTTQRASRSRVPAPPPPAAARPVVTGDRFDALAACESTGDRDGVPPHRINPRAYNPAGYYGAFQFSLSTWRSVGGSGDPRDASYAEQKSRAVSLQARSGWGQWPGCSRALGYR